MNFRQIKAIEAENKKRILQVNPDVPDRSGIYFLLREDSGFKYAYIGQAKNLLTRLAQHLSGYQHIDLSLKKYGLFSQKNPAGYHIHFLEFDEADLDFYEKKYIKQYAAAGYQLKNATAGGQGTGKHGLDNSRPRKGYAQGVENGYLKARKEVAHLFDLHLNYSTKKEPPTKNQEKALQKFKDFLNIENEKGE